jgi:photosystem II stability/assembly factor-like uncharacterized protein
MRTLSTILIASLFFGSAQAQWVQTSLDSVYVTSIAVSDTNIFVGTSGDTCWCGDGVFRSANNGTSWIAVNDGLSTSIIDALVVSGTNLFAGTVEGGVFRSTNNGTNWTAVNSGLPDMSTVHTFAVSDTNLFVGTGNGICGCDGGVYLTTNNGANWTATGLNPGYISFLAISPNGASGTNLYAIGGSKIPSHLFLSTDNGTNWISLNYMLSGPLVVSGSNLFAGSLYGGVELSTNDGTSWAAVNDGLTNTYVGALAVSGANLFIGTWGGVFLSTNNGTNWNSVSDGLTDSVVTALTISSSYLYAGTRNGAWKRPLSEMITAVHPVSDELPKIFNLEQNYPNPFNPVTTINYQLPNQSHVTLKIFDVLGREVATLVNGIEQPGYKTVNFSASKLASGVYYYRIQVGSFIETKKLLLLK